MSCECFWSSAASLDSLAGCIVVDLPRALSLLLLRPQPPFLGSESKGGTRGLSSSLLCVTPMLSRCFMLSDKPSRRCCSPRCCP
jgi:hypothetical protein